MDVEQVVALVRDIAAVDLSIADRVQLADAVAKNARLKAWCDGREVGLGKPLAERSGYGERAIADAAKLSMRQAAKVLERAATADAVPAFGRALGEGDVSAAHVDAVTTALRQVEPAQRRKFVKRVELLLPVAMSDSAYELARRLTIEVGRTQADDGMDKHERQRRATSLRSWVDKTDGMWRFSFACDPLTGVKVSNQIDAEVAALFATKVPAGCPSDPVAKQAHLRALALLSLLEGNGGRAGRPEVIVVFDTTAVDEHGRPTVDWGLPVDIPDALLRDLVARAKTTWVAVHPPAPLDLGRRQRLASAAQRRVLRAMYPTCAIDRCPTRFDHTKPHHVWAWDDGGPTDLDNLLPLCSRHHTAVHHGGWQVKLLPDRTLTVTASNGTTMTTGPPTRAP